MVKYKNFPTERSTMVNADGLGEGTLRSQEGSAGWEDWLEITNTSPYVMYLTWKCLIRIIVLSKLDKIIDLKAINVSFPTCIRKASAHSAPSGLLSPHHSHGEWKQCGVPAVHTLGVNSVYLQGWRGTEEQPLTSDLGVRLVSMLNASKTDYYKYQKESPENQFTHHWLMMEKSRPHKMK